MRMKFNKSSQLMLVTAASLLAAVMIAACGTATTDFVFVTSAKAAGPNNYGEIDVFEINRTSGAMRQIPSSPFPSQGRDPVAEAVSSDYANLYVVNQDDNTIVQFMIGNDGKLYPQNTVNTPGTYPLAVAVSGTSLFVVDTYQPLPSCSIADPCSGSVGVFPLLPSSGTGSNATLSGAPGTPLTNPSIGADYWPLTLPSSTTDVIVPTAVNVLTSGAYLYVTTYDSSVTPNVGYVFGFSIGSSGALTPLNGGVPFVAGVHPSAIASDSTSTYVYVTDSVSGNVLGYQVASGLLTPLAGSPFPAGDQPSAIVVDPTYPYAYVANSTDGNVTAYSISSGALTRIGTYAAGIDPVAMGIDPATHHFLFTANFTPDGVSGTVSNFELSATAGILVDGQNSPYSTNANPTAVVAVPHKAQ
jgi:6-phosphogluconolactonase (cycloisomerase 2 family)